MARIRLTELEKAALQAIARGEEYAQIQKRHKLTYAQVRAVVKDATEKCGAKTTLHAVAIAASFDLIAPNRRLAEAVERAEMLGPLPDGHYRMYNHIARGDSLRTASRKINCYDQYAQIECRKLRKKIGGIQSVESLIAVLVWAELIDTALSSGTSLSAFERKMLSDVVAGKAAKAVGQQTGASASVVARDRAQLLRKMNAATWYRAVALAVIHGDMTPSPAIHHAAKRFAGSTLFKQQRMLLEALAAGSTVEESCHQAGYASLIAHRSVLYELKVKAGVDLSSSLACFAALIWARQIRVKE